MRFWNDWIFGLDTSCSNFSTTRGGQLLCIIDASSCDIGHEW